MSNKQFRIIARWVHIIVAAVIGTYLYSPWGDIAAFTLIMQVVVFPVMVLTGIALWQQPRIMKLLRGSKREQASNAS